MVLCSCWRKCDTSLCDCPRGWPAKERKGLNKSGINSAVWVKVAQVYFSEMRSGVKMGSPPGFLCHTN